MKFKLFKFSGVDWIGKYINSQHHWGQTGNNALNIQWYEKSFVVSSGTNYNNY